MMDGITARNFLDRMRPRDTMTESQSSYYSLKHLDKISAL